MKLPFTFAKKQEHQYFLALLLRDKKASAVIFEELSGKIRVVGEHEEYFKESIEEAPLEELLEVLDKTISHAENSLPPDVITKKTIFGVKEDWVEDSHIKNEYILRLKKVCEELNLTPIGFLVLTEAIARLLEKEEGSPISAILIEVGSFDMTMSLIRAGRVIESKQAKIEDSIPQTSDQLLHHFGGYEVLPARIIIYGIEKNEKLLQEFTKHHWSKSLPFLHVPQTTILPQRFDAKAVLFGAASQMGFEVLGEDVPALKEVQPYEKSEKPQAQEEPESEPKETEEQESISAQDLGFVKGVDIAKISKTHAQSSIVPDEKSEEPSKETEEHPKDQKDLPTPLFQLSHIPSIIIQTLMSIFPKKHPASDTPRSAGVSSSVPSFKRSKKIIFIPPLIILVGILLILFYVLGMKATIILDVKPKIDEKDQDVVFSATASTDFSKNTIAAEPVSISLDGQADTPATGKKETGTKAKGTVTLFSRLSQSKTLDSGTTIKDSHGLEFTLDKSVSLASSSADASANPATATTSVTAKDIGKEQNLPSSTKFTVGSFDAADIVAKNDQAFSGGTKKEITVVSADDLKKLANNLPSSLEQKAREQSSQNLSPDKAILPVFLTTSIDKKNYSKNASDEASSVTLKATVSFQGLSYKKNDVLSYAQGFLKDDLQTMTIAKNGITYEIKNSKSSSDKAVNATIHTKALLLPKLQSADLAKTVAGKSFDEAQDILRKSPQVTSVTISFDPKIPFLPKILPRLSKNIEIITKDNE